MIEERLVNLLKEKGYYVATAESCTGGMVAAKIVNVSGASEVFNEGYITYSNEAKNRVLDVSEELLQTVGAVSEEVAMSMARGCAAKANVQVGISTTGIAGPLGGTKEKPVGLVYIGCSINDSTHVLKKVFDGDRTSVRTQAVECALKLAYNMLKEE